MHAGTDTLVLLLYVALVLGVGLYFGTKSRDPYAFTAARGRLPAWAVGLSIFGTYLSSNTFLGVPGKAFGSNFNFFVFSISLPFAVFFASTYFVPFYRRQGEISAYQHLEKRFGTWARLYAMTCYLLTQLARIGTILFGVALGLEALTGWNIVILIIGMGTLVTLYTLVGGIEAVIWTDVIQSIVLLIGAVIILFFLIHDTPGGFAQTLALAHENQKFSLGSWHISLRESTVWVVLLYGFFINLNNFGIDQGFIQRYHAANSTAAAKRSLWIGALMYVPVSLIFFLIGASLFAFYFSQPDQLALLQSSTGALDSASIPADKVLPHFIVHHLPTGLSGLILAALFAAAMSSIDTSLNSSATVLYSDFYKRLINPNPSDKAAMRILYIGTILWGVLGTLTALLMISVESILDAWWTLSGVFSGGVLGLFLLGLINRKTQRTEAFLSLSIGLLIILWMTFSKHLSAPLQSPFHTHMTIVIGTLSIFLIGVMLTTRKALQPEP